MRKRFTALFITLAMTSVFGAPLPESRTHYVIATRDRAPAYHVTSITRTSQVLATETYLIEDVAGQKFSISVERNFESGHVKAEYKVDSAPPVRVSFALPSPAHTSSDTLEANKTIRI